jgi:thiaminase/transcriptional activator TenA
MSAPLHENLWERNRDIADACRKHRFATEVAEGTLKEQIFRRYIAQDAFFLDSFVRAYALAVAHCRSFEDVQAFHSLLGGVIEEKKLHQDYAEKLGVSLPEMVPNWACRAYTDFLLRTAWNSGIDEILAAMTPCMKLYSYLGSYLARNGLPDHCYQDWIRTYSSEEFSELTRKIEGLLDHHATDSQPVRDVYRYAMVCELNFFSAVFEEPEGVYPKNLVAVDF